MRAHLPLPDAPSPSAVPVVGVRPDTPRRGLSLAAGLRAAARAVFLDRSTRVRVLLAAIIAMSIVDLDMTLVYARSTGMVENNPIARQIMSTGSAGLLVVWKFVTVSIAVGLLHRVRRHASGEIGAWLCMAVLLWLTQHWVKYTEEIAVLQCAVTSPAVRSDPKFVMIGDVDP